MCPSPEENISLPITDETQDQSIHEMPANSIFQLLARQKQASKISQELSHSIRYMPAMTTGDSSRKASCICMHNERSHHENSSGLCSHCSCSTKEYSMMINLGSILGSTHFSNSNSMLHLRAASIRKKDYYGKKNITKWIRSLPEGPLTPSQWNSMAMNRCCHFVGAHKCSLQEGEGLHGSEMNSENANSNNNNNNNKKQSQQESKRRHPQSAGAGNTTSKRKGVPAKELSKDCSNNRSYNDTQNQGQKVKDNPEAPGTISQFVMEVKGKAILKNSKSNIEAPNRCLCQDEDPDIAENFDSTDETLAMFDTLECELDPEDGAEISEVCHRNDLYTCWTITFQNWPSPATNHDDVCYEDSDVGWIDGEDGYDEDTISTERSLSSTEDQLGFVSECIVEVIEVDASSESASPTASSVSVENEPENDSESELRNSSSDDDSPRNGDPEPGFLVDSNGDEYPQDFLIFDASNIEDGEQIIIDGEPYHTTLVYGPEGEASHNILLIPDSDIGGMWRSQNQVGSSQESCDSEAQSDGSDYEDVPAEDALEVIDDKSRCSIEAQNQEIDSGAITYNGQSISFEKQDLELVTDATTHSKNRDTTGSGFHMSEGKIPEPAEEEKKIPLSVDTIDHVDIRSFCGEKEDQNDDEQDAENYSEVASMVRKKSSFFGCSSTDSSPISIISYNTSSEEEEIPEELDSSFDAFGADSSPELDECDIPEEIEATYVNDPDEAPSADDRTPTSSLRDGSIDQQYVLGNGCQLLNGKLYGPVGSKAMRQPSKYLKVKRGKHYYEKVHYVPIDPAYWCPRLGKHMQNIKWGRFVDTLHVQASPNTAKSSASSHDHDDGAAKHAGSLSKSSYRKRSLCLPPKVLSATDIPKNSENPDDPIPRCYGRHDLHRPKGSQGSARPKEPPRTLNSH